MTHIAILGPDDQPNAKVNVNVIREHDLPGFFIVEDSSGKRLVVHGQKLQTRQ
jgi:hypothetical protein